jgi:hypothetical protein
LHALNHFVDLWSLLDHLDFSRYTQKLTKSQSQMKSRYLIGSVFIVLGVVWSTLITQILLAHILPVQLKNAEIWGQQVYLPSALLSIIFYLSLLTIWVYCTYHQRYKTSSEARKARGQWLLILVMGIGLNIFVLILFSIFTFVEYPSDISNQGIVDATPFEFLIPLMIINSIFLYWLPSCFISQRTLRFIPPFSYKLIKLTEKR